MMRALPRRRLASGMTLIELVIAVVVAGVAVMGMLALLGSIASRSAESMLRTQALGIARTYLDEILAMQFTADGAEANRSQYDDIQDYAALPDQVPRTRNGAAMAGLGAYRVTVVLQNNFAIGVGANSVSSTRITVTVTDPTGGITSLSGYRTAHLAQIMR